MSKRRNKPYHLRFHGDALGGYELLSLEERGAYTTLLDQMYDHGGPIRDDARNACAWLNCDVRVWKRIRAALVEKHAKLHAYTDAQDRAWLVNDRVQSELKLPTYAELVANLGDKFAIATPELSSKSGEKPKEIKQRRKTKNPEIAPLIPSPSPISPIVPKGDEQFELSPDPVSTVDEAVVAFDLWNETAKALGLPPAKTLDDGRRRALRKRLADGGLDRWKEAIEAVKVSAFLRGLRPGSDGRVFKAHLDFLCQPSSFRKVIEGVYGQDAPAPRPSAPTTPEAPGDLWLRRIQAYRKNGFWNRLDWGPAPGKAGCAVPPEILISTGFVPTAAKGRAA